MLGIINFLQSGRKKRVSFALTGTRCPSGYMEKIVQSWANDRRRRWGDKTELLITDNDDVIVHQAFYFRSRGKWQIIKSTL